MRVARTVIAVIAAMRSDPEHRMHDGRCPDCGGTGVVPAPMLSGLSGFVACPRGCAPIVNDEPEDSR